MTPCPIPFSQAMLRGLRRRCPRCDAPSLFQGYLKVRPICPACGAENGKHRVDDVASYFTVLIIGHLVVAPALAIPFFWTMPLWASMSILLAAVAAATLAALPYIKGAVLGALFANDQKKAA